MANRENSPYEVKSVGKRKTLMVALTAVLIALLGADGVYTLTNADSTLDYVIAVLMIIAGCCFIVYFPILMKKKIVVYPNDRIEVYGGYGMKTYAIRDLDHPRHAASHEAIYAQDLDAGVPDKLVTIFTKEGKKVMNIVDTDQNRDRLLKDLAKNKKKAKAPIIRQNVNGKNTFYR